MKKRNPESASDVYRIKIFNNDRIKREWNIYHNNHHSKTNIHIFHTQKKKREKMELTLEQLKQYDGTDPSKPIYIGVKGRVFDVSTGTSFYGPGGSYAMFAGKDASRALAKMSKNDEDVIGSLHGLSDKELGVLDDWEKKFEAKYPIVGSLAAA